MKTIILILFIWLIVINLYGFGVCAIDKLQARMGGRRFSEHHLFFVCFVGGALGIYIGMQVFRHKTRKAKFVIAVPVICAVWLLITAFAVYKYCFIL